MAPRSSGREAEARLGIPRTMFFQELMPFFRAFFEDLGFTVVYSQKTNKQVIHQGVEAWRRRPATR